MKKRLLNEHINKLEDQDLSKFETDLFNADLPNIYDRTKITLNFNEQLENEILKLKNPNIKYLDNTSFTYNVSLKRINDEFFTKTDHHNYDRIKFYNDIIENFLKIKYQTK